MKIINFTFVLMFSFVIVSCYKNQSDYQYVIDRLHNYKETHSIYPSSLKDIEVSDKDLYYCSDSLSYVLEFTSGDDLYIFASRNYFWDFVEGNADQFGNYTCKSDNEWIYFYLE